MTELDIITFLNSGRLERFALGLSNDGEHEEIEVFLAQDVLIGEELEKIYCTLDAFEALMSIKPSLILRAKMIKDIQNWA